MKVITTKKAPEAVGPYSVGIISNGLIYTSGMLGINPLTNTLEEGIEKQANQAFKNIEAILNEANSSLDKVIKTTLFLSDLANFSIVNEIYAKYFTSKPSRSCVEVKKLPKGALLEIEVIAEE